ncbi:putative 1,3-beta-D-glucan synthase subunit [Lobosporangium transversale]|uniref:1,3-beta-glucan synthase n=1 Tax=Lobosporangium transversale TaxID=64571 RepID=A0A1Y2GRA9_9FUNG|nr:putative 1,3-beta-D-glucan synthase subunit [Lobosporangium transversale]ORZ20022.1 putative 1,3-beta-D-glucan synthase subunit [Lobosporangium transversale]|eukprot:XP_021882562.1 putative 1,3-beta-D-glucan synthase subunit [Lobosporangium transversale]
MSTDRPESEQTRASQTYSGTYFSSSEDPQYPTGASEIDLFGPLRGPDDGRYIGYAPSSEALLSLLESKRSLLPGQQYQYGNLSSADNIQMSSQPPPNPYPSWTIEKQVPLTREEIEGIMLDLTRKFGFQADNMRNQYEAFMTMLDSRASRMSPVQALTTVHADYIGGEHANYRKWYFAAQLDLDDHMGYHSAPGKDKKVNRDYMAPQPGAVSIEAHENLAMAEEHWKTKMNQMSHFDRARQVALYLLLWGEGAQIRFLPECLCFIYKCAEDYYLSPECQQLENPVIEGEYLRNIVMPIYRFIRNQSYEIQGGKYVKRERDHSSVIGYDDINQAFWSPEGIARIQLKDKTRLVDIHIGKRWMVLNQVNWESAFRKTYIEKRTWLHLAVNFTRIWIIHVVPFWYFTAWNSSFIYMDKEIDGEGVHYSIVALGGAIATLIMLLGVICEFMFIPLTWSNSSMLVRRLAILVVVLVLNAGPSVYVCGISRTGTASMIVGITQLTISLITTLVFAIVPSNQLFGAFTKATRKNLASQTFTASFPKLNRSSRALSYFLWTLIFACKMVESYFFLARSFKEPLKVLYSQRILNCKDKFIGQSLCNIMPVFTIIVMLVVDFVLFFLDTYLWYVIWNTIFSVFLSFKLGISVWTPWRDIFSRLPKRIYAKILAAADMDIKYKPKVLCSQIWNAIVISMYREHLLSIEHVQRLLYQQVPSENEIKRTLKAPIFFVAQEDSSLQTEFYPKHSEAERRITFFAQSLATPIHEPLPVDKMPTFTVLVPHYSEKTLLSLREVIREEDQNSRVTLLEYLKQLHPVEWDNFVRDTKILAEESTMFGSAASSTGLDSEKGSMKDMGKVKSDDLPFYCIGFKSAAPEYTLRTRIWASLRAQTLYRTVSGFMNYSKAIKLLYRVENPAVVQQFGGNGDRLERELDRLSRQKFKFLVSMQRYTKFSKEEAENAEFLLRAYPQLQITYLDEHPSDVEGEEPIVYSVLIDGQCEVLPDGKRKPRFMIRLPGNPILGDGKSDNQNHAIVFSRGEYIQLVDANQDNYLEETLKIRNVLGEFEQYHTPGVSPYSPQIESKDVPEPVAIVGAREYIFSENIGVLGDVAAGKEQTFGTLTQRMMAKIGGKLHYGHPDFLNFIFMSTRGGVSKAQKGLHLNEDIYAGMMAFSRGGRIKHTEYIQCGKGRDLGFGSILNFNTKIGTGMGEQMLSREYYYLGTQLPLDRFLTFYYAHPGFHVNNIFIMLSIQLFLFSMLFIGAMASSVEVCSDIAQDSCVNLVPVYDWIKRCVLSIFLVFFIAFLPLFLQEFMERGFARSIIRLGKHFMSLSPLFEVFVTQIYANSILTNLSFGGARYIATGRGFATTRTPFALLYPRFAGPSLYLGIRMLIMLIFASLTMWVPHLIYFWVSVLALIISPFIFNPHQFAFTDFLIDYREFLRWLSRGNSRTHVSSWISYCRTLRTRITGYKRKRLGHPSEKLGGDIPRANFLLIFFSEIVLPFIQMSLCTICYMFVRSFPSMVTNNGTAVFTSGLLRVGIFALGPLVVNAGVLAVLFGVSLLLGPLMNMCCIKFGSIMAAIAHAIAVISQIFFFEAIWALEAWNAAHAVLGVIAAISVQRFAFKVTITMFLTREFKHDETNRAWWTGKWHGRGLGLHAVSQPLREYLCKIIEMSMFSCDFIMGHLILFMLFPACLIPWADRWHSIMLFWLRPSKQIRPPIFPAKIRAQRRRVAWRYGILFVVVFVAFIMMIIAPLFFQQLLPQHLEKLIPI